MFLFGTSFLLSEFAGIIFLAGCCSNSQTHILTSKHPVPIAKMSESGAVRGGFNSNYDSSEGH